MKKMAKIFKKKLDIEKVPMVLYQVCFVWTDLVMIRCRRAYYRSRRVLLSKNIHFAYRFMDRWNCLGIYKF